MRIVADAARAPRAAAGAATTAATHYVEDDRRQADPGGRQGQARDQRRRLLRHHRLHPATRSSACSRPPRTTAFAVRLHAEQLSQPERRRARRRNIAPCRPTISNISTRPAPRRWPRPGTVAVLLPGAFYALQENAEAAGRSCCASTSVPIAIATDCNPGTSPLLSPTLAMNMACTLFGLTPEEALAGMTINAARALGLAHDIGSIAAGKAADLCVWRIESLAELGYWIGLPGPGAAHFRMELDAR